MPLVGVAVPTVGRPELVRRAVQTALAQTVHDIEVIVVIDGDDPATHATLTAIQDGRLRIVTHSKQQGAVAARDSGAASAASRWVALLDDDDEWLPTKLAAQLAAEGSEPAVLTTLSRVIGASGEFIRPGEPYDEHMPVDEWLFDRRTWTRGGESFLQCSSLMMPRALFDVIRFADMNQHDDWEFVLRAVKQHGYPLITVAEPLVIYHMPEVRASLSRTHTWDRSILWAVNLREILTRRAISGFLLTVAAQMAASFGHRDGFGPLFNAAWRYGSPTPKQIFAFAYFVASPVRLRRRLRALMQAERR